MSERRALPMAGAPHALPTAPLSLAHLQANHSPGTIAHWAQLKRWPQALVAKLHLDPVLGPTFSDNAARVFSEVEVIELAHAAHAGRGTVSWWGLQKKWPAWMVAAMAAQRHANEVLTEDEAHALAESTAGLPLGRK